MLLYHYASNQSLLSILESRVVRLSDFSLSNDLLEGKWVHTVFRTYCERKNVASGDLEKLLRSLDGVLKISGVTGFCLSEEKDLLSQWRGYADDGAGVSIGFDSDYLESWSDGIKDKVFGFRLRKIEYGLSSQEELIQPVMDEILQLVADGALSYPTILSGDADRAKWIETWNLLFMKFLNFLQYLYSFKNPVFSEEREWRLVCIIPRGHTENVPGMLEQAEYCVRNGKIVPFVPIRFLEDRPFPIKELVIGPRNPTPTQIIYGMLRRFGFNDVAVHKSSASYR